MTAPTEGPRRRAAVPLQLGLVLAMLALLGLGVLVGTLRHDRRPVTGATAGRSLTPVGYQISGTVTAPTGGCTGAANGVTAGAPVGVFDAKGQTVATTQLGPGHPIAGGGCTWEYVASVTASDLYTIRVAELPAEEASRQQLAAQGWHIDQRDE